MSGRQSRRLPQSSETVPDGVGSGSRIPVVGRQTSGLRISFGAASATLIRNGNGELSAVPLDVHTEPLVHLVLVIGVQSATQDSGGSGG
jgi:hypothetical protein